jgi:putative salt-induced outer membrane protein YdiY/ketosteroid isomerase-like protein
LSSKYIACLADAARRTASIAALIHALQPAAAAAQTATEPRARLSVVRGNVRALADALVQRDHAQLERLLAPDFVLRSAPDITRDVWIRNAMTLCWGEQADIGTVDVRLHQDVAVASYQLTLYADPETCRPAVLRSLVTDVWTKGPEGWRLQVRHAGPPPASGAIAAQYGAAPAPPPVWQVDAELSFVATGGNASTRTLGVGSQATHRRNGGTTEMSVAFLTSEAEAVTQARSLKSDLRHAYALSQRIELFGRAAYARDRFAGIDHRVGLDAGLAFAAGFPAAHALTIEGSVGWTSERRLDASRLRFVLVAGTVEYAWQIAPGARIQEIASLVADVETARDWRGTHTAALTLNLTRLLSLKASHSLEYRNLPVPGFGRTDTRTAAALVLTFQRAPARAAAQASR